MKGIGSASLRGGHPRRRAGGSPWPAQRIPRGVAQPLNHDLVRQDPIKHEVGVGKHGDPPKATLADPASRMRVGRDELDHSMDATLDVTSA
jgi:hypothetical protein